MKGQITAHEVRGDGRQPEKQSDPKPPIAMRNAASTDQGRVEYVRHRAFRARGDGDLRLLILPIIRAAPDSFGPSGPEVSTSRDSLLGSLCLFRFRKLFCGLEPVLDIPAVLATAHQKQHVSSLSDLVPARLLIRGHAFLNFLIRDQPAAIRTTPIN